MIEVNLPLWAALPAAILLVCGGLLAFIGALGLLRLRDFFARMHPPAMGTTLGAGCVVIASALVSSAGGGRPVLHVLLIGLLLVISTPISAMTLMGAAMARAKNAPRSMPFAERDP